MTCFFALHHKDKLKRIDLTSNAISKIDDGALFGLPSLEELVIRENNVAQLPALPATMTLIDASHNHLGSTGIQNEAFKVDGNKKITTHAVVAATFTFGYSFTIAYLVE